jgi:hypothetical protein
MPATRAAVREWRERIDERKLIAHALLGKDITFAHRPEEPARRIQSVKWNGMVEVTGMTGEFAPHIFRVKKS